MYKYIASCCLLIASIAWLSCSESVKEGRKANAQPVIWPDYAGVTVPCNMAPLNFKLIEPCVAARAVFSGQDMQFVVNARDGRFTIPQKKWKELLKKASGSEIEITVLEKNAQEAEWITFAPFSIKVAREPVDPYLAYRLIDPGYELWGDMGIYQRNLESYEEDAIYETKMTNQNCVNCHSFCMQDPDKMLFHMRETFACTILKNGDKVEKLNTKTDRTMSSLVYPSWHPSGKYVAFSVNATKQAFHTNHKNRIEVFDEASDVVIYDVEKHEIISTPPLFSPDRFETFPTFSPDGKTLYFCTAAAQQPMPQSYETVKYSLCSISFDPATCSFGQTVDTLYNAAVGGKSASFPRVSPDGRYLLYTLSGFGNFSIWHKDADLYLFDLQKKTNSCLDRVNSDDVESYHSWSSNSRWFVFSSRRIDGLYTRPFIAYIDEAGQVSKPFLLPQKDVDFYQRFMKSYNIPEFVKGRVSLNKYKVAQKARREPGINVTFGK